MLYKCYLDSDTCIKGVEFLKSMEGVSSSKITIKKDLTKEEPLK